MFSIYGIGLLLFSFNVYVNMASRLYEVHNPVIKNNQKVTLRFRLVLINLDFPMSL